MRALGRTVAVLLAILAFVVTPPADAATRVLHFETTWLSANPNPGMPAHCMPSRTLQPAEGNYALGHGWAHSIGTPVPISLESATYTWTDCLYPETGQYRHVTALTPANPTLPTLKIESTHPISGADRDITWGSYLDDTAQATPSTILGRATHYETTFLSANPNTGMAPHCMPPRVLELAEANYGWGSFWAGNTVYLDYPRLGLNTGKDTYTWGDCLYPGNGSYRHVSSLDPSDDEHPDWPTAYVEQSWYISGTDRNVTWGSFLDRFGDD